MFLALHVLGIHQKVVINGEPLQRDRTPESERPWFAVDCVLAQITRLHRLHCNIFTVCSRLPFSDGCMDCGSGGRAPPAPDTLRTMCSGWSSSPSMPQRHTGSSDLRGAAHHSHRPEKCAGSHAVVTGCFWS